MLWIYGKINPERRCTMATFQDISITCIDCGESFVFSAGEQAYYAQNHLRTPKRCHTCRAIRGKASKKQQNSVPTPAFHTVAKSDIHTDKEHTLFIIGNGFDLMHGVPSSYGNFRDSIGKKNSLRTILETFLKVDDVWADFEEALGHLDVRMLLDDDQIDMWLDIYEGYDPDASAADFFAATEVIMEPAFDIMCNLQRRFRMWVESLRVSSEDRPLAGLITASRVLCFNYTEFIEDLYGVAHKNVCYIHGCRKKQKGHPKEELILGHRPVDQNIGVEPWKHRRRYPGRKQYIIDAARETVLRYLNWYDEQTTKDCGSIMKKHRAFFDGLQAVEQIVVIGHSLSPVDWDYFRRVNSACPDAHWYVSYYGEKDLTNCQTLMAQLGIRQDRVSVFKTS